MTETELAWKFLYERNGQIKSRRGDTTWTIGEWQHVKGEIRACKKGFHCSGKIYQAFGYVQGSVLAQVEVSGDTDSDSADKSAHRSMRIIRSYRWTAKDNVALAIYAAELVIDIFERNRQSDDRPRKAIEAVKKYRDHPEAAACAACDAVDAASDAADNDATYYAARATIYAYHSANTAANAGNYAYHAANASSDAADAANNATICAALAAAAAANAAANAADALATATAVNAAVNAADAATAANAAVNAADAADADADLIDKIEAWMNDRVERLELISSAEH